MTGLKNSGGLPFMRNPPKNETQLRMVYDVKDFAAEVIQKSFTVPVLVDFWAEWCAPCKMLGPVLERLAGNADGKWILASVNTEIMLDVAREYKISSIPNVKLFVDGNPVAEFAGALPEYQITRWLEKSLPSKHRKDVDRAAELLAHQHVNEGSEILRKVLDAEPENQQARILLASTSVFTDPDKAMELVKEISDPAYNELAEAIKVFSRMFHLRTNNTELPSTPSKPRYLQAIENLYRQDYTASLEQFIALIRDDRYYDDDGSRKACIAIFKYLGEEHEITMRYRRDFSSALY
jgi:putative thioredoxin